MLRETNALLELLNLFDASFFPFKNYKMRKILFTHSLFMRSCFNAALLLPGVPIWIPNRNSTYPDVLQHSSLARIIYRKDLQTLSGGMLYYLCLQPCLHQSPPHFVWRILVWQKLAANFFFTFFVAVEYCRCRKCHFRCVFGHNAWCN